MNDRTYTLGEATALRQIVDLEAQLAAERELRREALRALRQTQDALIAAPYLFGVKVPLEGVDVIDGSGHSKAIHATTAVLSKPANVALLAEGLKEEA